MFLRVPQSGKKILQYAILTHELQRELSRLEHGDRLVQSGAARCQARKPRHAGEFADKPAESAAAQIEIGPLLHRSEQRIRLEDRLSRQRIYSPDDGAEQR